MKASIQEARQEAVDAVERAAYVMSKYSRVAPSEEAKADLYTDYLDAHHMTEQYKDRVYGDRPGLPGYLRVAYMAKASTDREYEKLKKMLIDPEQRSRGLKKAKCRLAVALPVLAAFVVVPVTGAMSAVALPLYVSSALLVTSWVASVASSLAVARSLLEMMHFSKRLGRNVEQQVNRLQIAQSLTVTEVEWSLATYDKVRRTWFEVEDIAATSYLQMLEADAQGGDAGASRHVVAFGQIPEVGSPARLPYARLALEVDAVRWRDHVPAAIRYPEKSRAAQLSSALDRARGVQSGSTRLQADGFDFSV